MIDLCAGIFGVVINVYMVFFFLINFFLGLIGDDIVFFLSADFLGYTEQGRLEYSDLNR